VNLYIATKWELWPTVADLAVAAKRFGHTITYPWWVHEQASPEQALKDIAGVKTADVLIVLAEQEVPYRGVYVELGVALSAGIPVWLVGTGLDQCLFAKHPLVKRFSSLQPVLVLLATPEG